MLELLLLKKEFRIYRFLYLKVFEKELISIYSYGADNMFRIQLFNKTII